MTEIQAGHQSSMPPSFFTAQTIERNQKIASLNMAWQFRNLLPQRRAGS